MSVFKITLNKLLEKLKEKKATENWQNRSNLSQSFDGHISKLTPAELDKLLLPLLKNKTFVENLLSLSQSSYRHSGNYMQQKLSEKIVTKIYQVIKNDKSSVQNILQFKNVSESLLEKIIEKCASIENKDWYASSYIVNHVNFTKALEDKVVGSPKKYSFLYEQLAEVSKTEANLLKISKYLKDSWWTMRKLIKKRCLSHDSLEKIAKFAPDEVARHSLKLTPDFVDTLAESKDKKVVASAITNRNMRPETMRRLLEEADPTEDYSIIHGVAYNKKATVENLALAFSKCGTSIWITKEFLKHKDLVEHIQNKLKESK